MDAFRLFYGPASANSAGLVTTGTQTFSGQKTFGDVLRVSGGAHYPTSGEGIEISYELDAGYIDSLARNPLSWQPLYLKASAINLVREPGELAWVTCTTDGVAIGGDPAIGTALTVHSSTQHIRMQGGIGDGNIYQDNTYAVRIGTESNAHPIRLDGSQVYISSPFYAGDEFAVGPSPTNITNIAVYAASLTPAAVSAQSISEQTFSVSGLTTGDKLIVNGPSAVAIVNARVSAADTLALTFANPTTASVTPPAGDYSVLAVRS